MTPPTQPATDPAVTDGEDESIPPEAEGMAATVLLAAVFVLMAVAPFATHAQPPGKAWYLAPVNWPLFSLGIAVLSGGALAWRFVASWRAAPDAAGFRAKASWAFGGLRFALEHSLYFCVYLLAVAWIGFSFATLVFLEFVVWRSGLRGWKWAVTAFLVTVGIVIIFRLGIGLWFPLSPLLKLFPAWVGNSLGGFL